MSVFILTLTSMPEKKALERQHDVLQTIEARIELYYDIEAETRYLFEDGRELEQEAMRGFEMIQAASSGLPRGFHNPGLTVWRASLQEKKNSLEGASIEELDLIASIRERGVLMIQKQAFTKIRLSLAFDPPHFPNNFCMIGVGKCSCGEFQVKQCRSGEWG